jgi:hypothetical protein
LYPNPGPAGIQDYGLKHIFAYKVKQEKVLADSRPALDYSWHASAQAYENTRSPIARTHCDSLPIWDPRVKLYMTEVAMTREGELMGDFIGNRIRS